MKHKHDTFISARLKLDSELYNQLKDLGFVNSKAQLGRLCGKNDSYFATMHHKGYGLQLGSLTILASRFSRLAETELDSNRQIQINRCMDIVNKTIDAKIRLNEAENAFN